jgi:glycosyltransferase involved in cell wall biosynthesis
MNINYYAPINATGYGIASLNILKSLNQLNSGKISYFPIGEPRIESQEDYNLIHSLFNNSRTPDPLAPCIKIWHQFDLMQRIGNGKYYAMPFFELDTFNETEKIHLTAPDGVFVPSKWAQEVLKNNNISTPSHIVPLGIDNTVFNANKIKKTRKDNKYVFLNIGKWEVRKGHDILLHIFNEAFPNEQDVELWILASEKTNSYSQADELQKWKTMYSNKRVKLFNGFDSHREIAYLIAESDCGLYPSRAEGWNLELLETMSMNKPVICTNYSAHTEFCNSDNSYLIDIEDTEPAFDGKAFQKQGNWAKIGQKQKDQMIHYMRYCYQNKIDNNIHGINTANKFTWKYSAKNIMGYIS